jgi:1-acyl-sn-glycerol-3-phosphate acyltransferase
MSQEKVEGGRRKAEGSRNGVSTPSIDPILSIPKPIEPIPPSPLPLPPSNPRPQSPAPSPFLSYLAQLWYSVLWGPCYAISQVLFRYRFSGKSHVPLTGPVLLVANHQSNLDPVLIGIACPRQLKYLARVGLFFWPFSWWIRALGATPIDRESAISGIKATLRLLKGGNAVVLFPEGSRTPDGLMYPLLPGFCVLARRSGATVVPVAIDGAFAALPRGAALPRPARITLAFAPKITRDDYAQLSDAQLTELVTQRLRDAGCKMGCEIKSSD